MPVSALDVRARTGRRLPWLLTAMIIAGMASIAGAQAQNYPWCSNFADGAGTNCGFSTEQQCRAVIMGSGGYCDRNTQYRAPDVTAPAPGEERKHHADKSS